MVKVAVAGGSEGIGKAIVDAIRKQAQHEVITLSRQTSSDAPDNATTVAVDYTSVDKLREVLEAHDVHTVICVVAIKSDAGGEAQMNLIEAAEASRCTKRFMPSEFGIKYQKKQLHALPVYKWKFQAIERLESSSLEWTLFSPGQVMDYGFAPRIPSAFAFNVPMFVDLEHKVAVIPGDGDAPVVQTHSRDIARFVAEVLNLEPSQWARRFILAGDRLSDNEFVRIAEEVSGSEFQKHYEPLDKLRAGDITLVPAIKKALPEAALPPFVHLLANMAAFVAAGDMDLVAGEDGAVDVRTLFPDIETLTVREAVKIWYGK